MPELPEVECLSRAVGKVVEGGLFEKARFLRKDLRDPIPISDFKRILVGQRIESVERRSKYMLIRTESGFGIIHLGMTGNIICQDSPKPAAPHTHAIFQIRTKSDQLQWLHYIDPRRFGRISAMKGHDLEGHDFFKSLGPEPLEARNLGTYLFQQSRRKKKPIKNFIMDGGVLVGVGNIYAAESLFKARIHPEREAQEVSLPSYNLLAKQIKATLRRAIKAGGTTFRDFKNVDGNPGYFRISLAVYDRTGKPCVECRSPIVSIKQSGRSTWFCEKCQK
jgi:formamidopyrimidine-DNA glycosylase